MSLKDYYNGRDDAKWNSVDYRRNMRDWDYWDGVHACEREKEDAAAERRHAEAAREQREREEAEEYERALADERDRQEAEEYYHRMAEEEPCPE